MKILCLLITILVLLFTSQGHSQSLMPTNPIANVTLAWDPCPVTNNIAHYAVYWGVLPMTYTNKESSLGTNATLTVSNLVRGTTYYFAATATATNSLESAFSNEVSTNLPAPPTPPTVFRIVVGN